MKLANGAHDKLQEVEDVSTLLAELIKALIASITSQVQMSEIIYRTMEDVVEVSWESSF